MFQQNNMDFEWQGDGVTKCSANSESNYKLFALNLTKVAHLRDGKLSGSLVQKKLSASIFSTQENALVLFVETVSLLKESDVENKFSNT